MSDPDRGAYTPPTEPPLSFDARKPVRGRRQAPMMLIVSGLVLLLMLVAIFIFYRSGVRQSSETPPVVGTPVGQMKSAPPAGQQPSDPAQGLQIYQQAEGQAAPTAPNFVAPPEQPKARPLPQVITPPAPNLATGPQGPIAAMPLSSLKPSVSATAPPPAAKPAPTPMAPPPKIVAAPEPAKPLPVAPKVLPPKPLPAPPKAAAPVPAPAKPAPPKPTVTAPAPAKVAPPVIKPTPTAPAAGGGSSVQIGAFSSPALADKEWAAAVKSAPGKGKRVEAVPKNGGTLYRTTVTGFGSRADAAAFCDKLKAAGKACFVK